MIVNESEHVEALADEAGRLVAQISPLLAGRPPAAQGAALVELLAIWIAGHVHPTSEEVTARRRAELLAVHVGTVEELVPVVAKRICGGSLIASCSDAAGSAQPEPLTPDGEKL